MKKENPHRQRLTITDIQKAINGIERKLPISSVPTPLALSTKQCSLETEVIALATQIKASLGQLKQENENCWLIAMIMLESGCRVSEVLNIRSTDITPTGRIVIKGLKRSHDRVINPSSVAQQTLKKRNSPGTIFMGISRFHVYRSFKSVGLQHSFNDRERNSVTHLFRHYVALDLQQTDHGKKAITTGLGHKSNNSADHYAHKNSI
jgi:integrase